MQQTHAHSHSLTFTQACIALFVIVCIVGSKRRDIVITSTQARLTLSFTSTHISYIINIARCCLHSFTHSAQHSHNSVAVSLTITISCTIAGGCIHLAHTTPVTSNVHCVSHARSTRCHTDIIIIIIVVVTIIIIVVIISCVVAVWSIDLDIVSVVVERC